jgi:hypothetical protein
MAVHLGEGGMIGQGCELTVAVSVVPCGCKEGKGMLVPDSPVVSPTVVLYTAGARSSPTSLLCLVLRTGLNNKLDTVLVLHSTLPSGSLVSCFWPRPQGIPKFLSSQNFCINLYLIFLHYFFMCL